jgi:Flp pilus assembly protein TadG
MNRIHGCTPATASVSGGMTPPAPRRPRAPQPTWLRKRWDAQRRRADRDAGSASVELVIATPLLGLLLLSIVQFGVWAHATHIAQAAANSALQSARAYRGSAADGDGAAHQILDQSAGSILSNRSVTVTRTATTVTVTITGTATTVVPGLRLPVTVTVTGPVERVVALAEPSTMDAGG